MICWPVGGIIYSSSNLTDSEQTRPSLVIAAIGKEADRSAGHFWVSLRRAEV